MSSLKVTGDRDQSCCSNSRLQKHKITLQLHMSTGIYADMARSLLICPYFLENQPVNCYAYYIPHYQDHRLNFWSLGVILRGGHSTPRSLVLPVKIWHGFELLSMTSFPVDPNGFGENRVQVWLAWGSLCWWSGQRLIAVTQEDLPDLQRDLSQPDLKDTAGFTSICDTKNYGLWKLWLGVLESRHSLFTATDAQGIALPNVHAVQPKAYI